MQSISLHLPVSTMLPVQLLLSVFVFLSGVPNTIEISFLLYSLISFDCVYAYSTCFCKVSRCFPLRSYLLSPCKTLLCCFHISQLTVSICVMNSLLQLSCVQPWFCAYIVCALAHCELINPLRILHQPILV